MTEVILTIELVPRSAWYANLRKELPSERWDTLRRAAYREAGYKCQVCGGVGPKHPVEAHELWAWDEVTGIQKLVGITALCPDCHTVKHIGLAQIQGRFAEARAHLMKINEWTGTRADEYIDEAFEVWRRRSCLEWKHDLAWLQEGVST